ncbi:hypothetical protein PR048_009971 [Dryococelus australis]|uniref:DDE Tnp4 domain-containing protein n=1 Tax=Dryococelus australis TaxID=614101 RepID=A0ABQ9I1E3_9NEOP|nr:hypothetical protein PR048_009971 [Dryococelus australis]
MDALRTLLSSITLFYTRDLKNELGLPPPSALPRTNNIVPYVFLGDSAFGLNNHFMKPYPLTNILHEEHIYNYRLSRVRRVAENAFVILASRPHTTMSLSVEKFYVIILACCVLHNFMLKKNTHYIADLSFDREDTDNCAFHPSKWRLHWCHFLSRTSENVMTTERKCDKSLRTTSVMKGEFPSKKTSLEFWLNNK